MKKVKESILSIIPQPNAFNFQKVINRSDIQLHDVLVNGMRLNRFKAYQQPLPILIYRPLSDELLKQESSAPTEDSERMDTLFKNQQIKNRLKSVDKDFVSNLKIKTQTATPKKFQGSGLDISLSKRSPLSFKKKGSDSSAILKRVQHTELNNSYNNNLKKQLEARATNYKFGVVEHHTSKRGKYVGLRVSRERRKTIEKEINLDQRNQDRSLTKLQVERHKLNYSKDLQLEDSENKEQESNFVKIPQKRSKKLLKVCFSTKRKDLISGGLNKNFVEFVDDAIKANQF